MWWFYGFYFNRKYFGCVFMDVVFGEFDISVKKLLIFFVYFFCEIVLLCLLYWCEKLVKICGLYLNDFNGVMVKGEFVLFL